MRGLVRLIACLSSLTRATPFVLPSEDAIEHLRDAIRDELTSDQAVPVIVDSASPEVPTFNLEQINALADHEPHDADGDNDHVQAWLDSLGSSEASSGATLTASLFPSTTLSSSTGHTTPPIGHFPLSDTEQFPEAISTAEPPAPTHLNYNAYGRQDQQPLGGLGETWRVAKLKAQSVVALIASHITDCPSRPKTAVEVSSGITSTITARTLEATATSLPKEDVHSAISHIPALGPVDLADYASEQSTNTLRVVDAAPTASISQPLPGHIAPSSNAATATAAVHYSVGETLQVDQLSPDSKPTSFTDPNPPNGSGHPQSLHVPQYVFTIILPVVLTVILTCIIFSILIRRNPRRRAECLARCEERHNQRLYRRALRQHRIETWTQKILARPPMRWFVRRTEQDLAEKGLLGAESRLVPNNTISSEIRSFHEAHELVGNMIHAEQGNWSNRDRRRTYMWLFAGRARRQRAMSNASSDLSDSEKSAPPLYEDREYDEKIDPAIYMGRGREDAQDSDKSSVSSIIPTSPRQSTYTFSAGEPDSDKE